MSPETLQHDPDAGPPDFDGWPAPTREVLRTLDRAPVWATAPSPADDERAAG